MIAVLTDIPNRGNDIRAVRKNAHLNVYTEFESCKDETTMLSE